MKKLCLVFLSALCLITSCNTENYSYRYNYQKKRLSPLERASQKYAGNRKIKPTETVQLGAKQNNKFVLNDGGLTDFSLDNTENTDGFINEDGSYAGQYKVGNPYQINKVTYHPQQYDNFEEVGTASWYGDDFNGKKTANGEIYNKGDMTAAHPTLPLPSMVRITNLSSGKSVIVRVNDRGPFSKKRIVDVSEKAADELGFKGRGIATVKLEFLPKETGEMLGQLGIIK